MQNINVTFDNKPFRIARRQLYLLLNDTILKELRFLSDRKVASLWVFSQHFFSFVLASSICLVSIKLKTCTFYPSNYITYYLYPERINFKNPQRNNSHFSAIQSPLETCEMRWTVLISEYFKFSEVWI